MSPFTLARGTVIGRAHLQPLGWRNNQDALCVINLLEPSGIAIAVIADGCSSGAEKGKVSHNEVGAKIASSIVAQSILRHLPRYLQRVDQGGDSLTFPYWEDVRQDALSHIRVIASAMDASLPRVVMDYFLFTLIGFVVTPHGAFVFSIGDGVYCLNGQVTRLEPAEGNKPAYVGYGLLRSDQHDSDPEACKFKVPVAVLTESVESILVGTDGLGDFVHAAEARLPGKKDIVGPLSQFWEQDHYFTNPDQVRRTLALVNNASSVPDWGQRVMQHEPGLLSDDVTLAVIRRSKPKTKGIT
ncbi:MAG: protein phosphatase 2C domain-containing protein [Candidatus Paceibacterota bacterium]|jgi:hypothetical protein